MGAQIMKHKLIAPATLRLLSCRGFRIITQIIGCKVMMLSGASKRSNMLNLGWRKHVDTLIFGQSADECLIKAS